MADNLNGGSYKNPWSFDNLDEYLFYCCPQCDHRCKSKPLFIYHAFKTHPEAKDEIKNSNAFKLMQVGNPEDHTNLDINADLDLATWEAEIDIKKEQHTESEDDAPMPEESYQEHFNESNPEDHGKHC